MTRLDLGFTPQAIMTTKKVLDARPARSREKNPLKRKAQQLVLQPTSEYDVQHRILTMHGTVYGFDIPGHQDIGVLHSKAVRRMTDFAKSVRGRNQHHTSRTLVFGPIKPWSLGS